VTEPDHIRALGTPTANKLQKWGSLWADLLHVDMTLDHRRKLEAIPANVFARRALWEAAVVAYGRMAVSDRRRKVEVDDLLDVCGGDDARALHERIMDWRHGHIAHRNRTEFEQVTVAAHYDDSDELDTITLVVAPAVGPLDEGMLDQFESHIYRLRNTLWERFLAPLAVEVARDNPTLPPRVPPEISRTSESDQAVFSINFTLWQRAKRHGAW